MFRFERGDSSGGGPVKIRASQGRSYKSGVAEDGLPIDDESIYMAHGSSYEACRAAVMYGLDSFPRV